jgi:hypothetical protein
VRGDATNSRRRTFLEAQPSLLTNLALDLAEGANDRMPYPELIKALRVPECWEQGCLELGRDRNRVKHRGLRHECREPMYLSSASWGFRAS